MKEQGLVEAVVLVGEYAPVALLVVEAWVKQLYLGVGEVERLPGCERATRDLGEGLAELVGMRLTSGVVLVVRRVLATGFQDNGYIYIY